MRKIEDHIIIYLKAILLPYLFIYVKTENYLEYTIGNFLDPPLNPKKKETTEQYLDRIKPSQAVRYTRYNYQKCVYFNAPYHVSRPDLSMYEPKSREILETLVDTLFMMEDDWKEKYQKAIRRRVMER